MTKIVLRFGLFMLIASLPYFLNAQPGGGTINGIPILNPHKAIFLGEVPNANERNLDPCGEGQPFYYILEIISPDWNVFVCPEDPDIDPNGVYEGQGGPFKDFYQLVTIPYSTTALTNTPDNNHTFWFQYGAYDQISCGDDFDQHNMCDYSDNGNPLGVFEIPDQWVEWNSSFSSVYWINFLTQCENCTFDSGGIGAWHKEEMDMGINELTENIYSSPNGVTNGLDIEFIMTVECDPFSQYGCQDGELD